MDEPVATARIVDPAVKSLTDAGFTASGIVRHGDVADMPLIAKAEPLSMSWCLDCHRDPAKNLRPESEIFDTAWQKPADQEEKGAILLKHYGIRPDHLTDCSVCHR